MSKPKRQQGQLEAAVLFFEMVSASEGNAAKRAVYLQLLEESRKELARFHSRSSAA